MLIRHALRNAAVPIVTVIGISIALLIGGVVVTESVYNIPGLGRLTVDAVLGRDYPTIQAVILVFSFVYVLVNLLVDLDLQSFLIQGFVTNMTESRDATPVPGIDPMNGDTAAVADASCQKSPSIWVQADARIPSVVIGGSAAGLYDLL